MTDAKPKIFRSPYRDIDLTTLRLLCDLHPWSLGDLCKHVDIEQSVLSMVFAGHRPLPARVARKFLQLIGMRLDGSLDPEHGFVLVEKPGREKELDGLLSQMFPEKAGVVLLSGAVAESGEPSGRGTVKAGRAFFDGRFAAVVHGGNGLASISWEANDLYTLKDYRTPEVLLSTDSLPSKLDILKSFAGSKFPMKVNWEDVITAAALRKIEPHAVLQWMTTNYPNPALGGF